MKDQLVLLINEMINQCSGYNSVTTENRELILNYMDVFNSNIDELILKFYEINSIVDNGGAPVLKQILKEL